MPDQLAAMHISADGPALIRQCRLSNPARSLSLSRTACQIQYQISAGPIAHTSAYVSHVSCCPGCTHGIAEDKSVENPRAHDSFQFNICSSAVKLDAAISRLARSAKVSSMLQHMLC